MARILVTGATGFIGSRVTRLLLTEGHTVAVLMRPQSDTWRISDVLSRLTVLRTDLAGLCEEPRAIHEFAPEKVLHLAWIGVGNQDRNQPEQLSNIRLSFELLRHATAAGCKVYVGLGSQAEYGPKGELLREDAACFPTTVYGAAKLCHCLEAEAFCRKHDVRFVWLRLFSSYGPGDDPSWMISYVTRSLLRGERPALTLGEQKWDFLYADDAAEAIVRAAESPLAQGVYNLGSGEAYPLRSVIEQIRDYIDPRLELGFGEVPYRADQVMWLQADISRLTADSGWHPRTSIQDGLRRVVDWHASQLHASEGARVGS
jgi:UDP-glucose 4-epimerase